MALLVVLAAGLTSCRAGVQGVHRVRRPLAPAGTEQVAVVSADSSAVIERFNGLPVEHQRSMLTEIELVPGLHTLQVDYREAGAFSHGPTVVSLDAKPGHRYRVHAQRIYEPIWKGGGTYRFHWTAWVENVATGEVVSGRKPRGYFQGTFGLGQEWVTP